MRTFKSLAINAAVALTASLGVGAAHAAACSAITVSPYAGPITPNYVTTDDLKLGGISSSQCAALYDTNANTKIAGDADELAFTTGVYRQLIGDPLATIEGPEKSDAAGGTLLDGITWTVTNNGSGSWTLSYTPSNPDPLDLVFFVKQSNGASVFLFSGIDLTGSSTGGTYEINWCNGSNPGAYGSPASAACLDNNAISHISLFVGGAPEFFVPEPGILAMIGIGFLGLAVARKRQRA